MKRIEELIKGFLIGLVNIIPGFSTGAMALILGVYDKCINAFSKLIKNPKETFKEIWALFVGLIIGIFTSVYLIATLLETIPLITTLFFVGLIIGSIPKQTKKCQGKQVKPKYLISLVVSVVLLVIIPLINTAQVNLENSRYTAWTVVSLFLVGIVGTGIMVIGGSGTIILMALGYYEVTVVLAKNIIYYSLNGLGMDALYSFLQLLPYIVGVLLGASLFSNFMKKLMDAESMTINYVILGLLTAAPVVVIIKMIQTYAGIINSGVYIWIYSIISLLIGFAITFFINRYQDKKGLKENIDG